VTEDVRDIDSAATQPESESEANSVTEEPTDEGTDGADDAEADSSESIERPRRVLPPRLRKIATVILALLLLISGGVATWLYLKQYRPDQQTDAGVARSVVNAASDGTTAVLSYSADSLDQDFATARSHLAGDFLSYFDQFSQQTVAPMARQKSIENQGQGVWRRGVRAASQFGHRSGLRRSGHHDQRQPPTVGGRQ